MMSGLAWLNELMQWIGRWFPRLLLVKSTHVGVRFTRGGVVTRMRPGLYCYWPITTEVVLVSTRLRTTETSAQLCDREVVAIVIQFAVVDPLTAVQHYNDIFSQLDDRAQAALTLAYAQARNNKEITDKVRRSLVKQFKPHGVEVYSVDIIQRGRVIPLKNLNDWANHAKADLE